MDKIILGTFTIIKQNADFAKVPNIFFEDPGNVKESDCGFEFLLNFSASVKNKISHLILRSGGFWTYSKYSETSALSLYCFLT